MTPQISIFLRNFSSEIQEVNSLLVSAYVFINKLQVNNNTLIKELLIREEDSAQYKNLLRFIAIIRKTFTDFLLEDLIELFEFVISPAEKEVNGAVYTPERIRRYIVEATLGNFRNDQLENLKIADISCGCGGFFISVIEYIHHRIDVSLEQLFSNLYGVDIESYSIERTKILLSLFAIQNGEDIRTININLYNANSLNFNWNSIQGFEENGGFDVIVGNPPYVSSSKISEENKKYLQCWSVSSTGKADMYIPFFQIGIECLNARGILGYITVSNFYRSVNGRAFRIYMSEHQYSLKMIDFGAEQVFKNRSTYTCICLIKKQRGDIEYCQAKSNELDIIDNYRFTNILYSNLSNKRGWLLQNSNIIENIKKIESIGTPLGKLFEIRNGFATLKNDVFILNVIKENEFYYYTKNKLGDVYKIEKDICRNAIKPNTLKSENEINDKIEKLLFPYRKNGDLIEIIPEDYLRSTYPEAYKYLVSNKSILSKRDKGTRNYSEWFAFGRSQAINIKGYKLLFPYFADYPHFVFSDDQDLLFYNGYAILANNKYELLVIQRILRSKVFWYYIKHTSKPYGSEYFALAKNYVKRFGVVNLSPCQKEYLLSLTNQHDIDIFLQDLYNLCL